MQTTAAESVRALFAGSGELPTLCRALDWNATALGSFESWPQALRSAVGVCLDATIPMAIWAGRSLTLIYNDAYAALLGPHRHPWALGRTARDVWSESWDRYGPELRRVMELGESVQHQDERFVRRTGGRDEEVFFSDTFTPIRDVHGGIVGALDILHDTTRHKEAGERLRVNEARLKFAQEAAGAGMWHWDLVTGEVNWSDQLYRIFGWDPMASPPVTLDAWREALHPDDRVRAETNLMRALRDGTPVVNEDRIVLPSGEVRWVNALGRTTFDAEGRPLYVSGICVDITERKRAEEALHRSEAVARERLVELEALYETAPIGLCVFDEQLRWVRVNKVIAEINGRPIEDHIGRTPREVVPDVGAQAEEALRTVLRTGERLDFEMTGTTPAQPGVERCWSEHWVPIRDPGGRITRISVAAEEITDRKHAARALAESEERFRTLADNIAQFAWMADETGSVVWYNQRWFDYTGSTPDEMKGWGWQKVHHPDHVARVVEKISHCFATGETWEDTFPLRGKDGTYRWFLSRAIPIRNESGHVVRWFGTNTDITEQRAAEEALRVTERRYRTLAENAPEAIARFDRQQRYTYVNAYGACLYGLSPDDMIGKTVTDLEASPARAAFWQQQFEHVAATGRQQSVDFQFDSPTFGRQHLSTVLVPEPGEDFSILAITHDVTRLKRAEHRLRESEARFRRLADAMPQLVWTARADGTIDYYNQRVEELFGFGRQDDGTVRWETAVHAEDLESTAAGWRRALQHESTYEVTHRLTRADGTTHWYLTRAIPIRDVDGRVVQWFGTTTDVDEQKRTEEALREADRQKNEFLAMLSHDLRNPFAVIRTALTLLEQAGAESLPGKRALTVLGRQVNQIGRLIDDLLDMIRLSKGKLTLKREAVELNALLRAIAEDHAGVFEREHVEFRAVVPPDALCASVDSARLTQAIGNLLQNAAKFTPDGGRATLTLRTEGAEAIVEVRDNGAGIQPELLDRLFDPLVQAHRTLHQSRGGLGLGLAVVKGIVELHGGSVSAASEGPGRGATFTIRLPLEQPAAGAGTSGSAQAR